MAKVLGVGGVFFKSPDPQRLYDWYAKWLGMEIEDWGIAYVPKNMPANAQTVWSASDFMCNLMVDDLAEALRQVQEGGAEMIGKLEKLEYGLFGWFIDPDGNKVELWEPSK